MPYHKKRHPRRNQDLRSDDKRAAEPRLHPPTIVLPAPATVIAGIKTLLINYAEDAGAGRKFTRAENTNVAAVRAWVRS